MASVFLQREAEIGNKDVIFTLKDDKYLQENHLAVDPNWKKYWKDFDYDNLYPFCLEIEEYKFDKKLDDSICQSAIDILGVDGCYSRTTIYSDTNSHLVPEGTSVQCEEIK